MIESDNDYFLVFVTDSDGNSCFLDDTEPIYMFLLAEAKAKEAEKTGKYKDVRIYRYLSFLSSMTEVNEDGLAKFSWEQGSALSYDDGDISGLPQTV